MNCARVNCTNIAAWEPCIVVPAPKPHHTLPPVEFHINLPVCNEHTKGLAASEFLADKEKLAAEFRKRNKMVPDWSMATLKWCPVGTYAKKFGGMT